MNSFKFYSASLLSAALFLSSCGTQSGVSKTETPSSVDSSTAVVSAPTDTTEKNKDPQTLADNTANTTGETTTVETTTNQTTTATTPKKTVEKTKQAEKFTFTLDIDGKPTEFAMTIDDIKEMEPNNKKFRRAFTTFIASNGNHPVANAYALSDKAERDLVEQQSIQNLEKSTQELEEATRRAEAAKRATEFIVNNSK